MGRRPSILGGLVVAAAAAAGVYILFTRAMTRARARLAGASETVETRFGAVEYAHMGEGEPVLVIHGASGGFDQALDMAGALADQGFRLIAPSRFGYLGSSLPKTPTPAMQADAYAELLDHLGIETVAVIGISAGAWSSLRFAIRYPHRCRALVLLAPAAPLPPGTAMHGGAQARAVFSSDFVAWAALTLTRIAPAALMRPLLGTDARVVRAAGEAEQARVRRILDHLLPMSARLAGTGLDIAAAAEPDDCPIEIITCPVLTVSASDDAFGTARRARSIASNAPDGQAVIYATGGHTLAGRHDEALAAVSAFLETA